MDVLFCGTDKFAARVLSVLLSSGVARRVRVMTPGDVQQTWGAKRMGVCECGTVPLPLRGCDAVRC